MKLLARPSGKETLVHQLRDYLHLVCHSLGLSTRIVPHQFRHTYASEMIRSGMGFDAVMKLLGHTSPEMTMRTGVGLAICKSVIDHLKSSFSELSPV
jgi:integrase